MAGQRILWIGDMCGRFASTATPEELMRRFGVTVLANLKPRWNVAPSQESLIIMRNGLHDEAVRMRWGLPPQAAGRSFLINARMETVREKPTFRDPFRFSRCIIVASGWYEWSAPKTPWHVQLSDGGVMAMAGLVVPAADGPRFLVVTSAADGGLAEIHHRAPLVLPGGAEARWLGGSGDDAAELLEAAPAGWFNWYRVTPEVGKVANDHPGLVTPHEAANRAPVLADQGDLFG
jgi:putative SOS response-associated peptidase YedK